MKMKDIKAIRNIFLCICLLFMIHPAYALTQQEQKIVNRLSQKINSIKTMQGEFTQIAHNGALSEGIIVLDRPGKLLFRYKPPVKMEVISDGSALLVHDKAANTRDIWPISQTPLRFLLEKNINLLEESKIINVKTDNNLTTITLEETTPAGTGRITLIVSTDNFEIRQWTIIDPQGLETTIALYNLEYGKPTDSKWFYINHQLLRERDDIR